jgi:hypothetical protein
LADDKHILADLHKEKHDEVTSERLARQEMEERSKLLGGDMSHTHLVKGLDYSLLDRRRREIQEDAIDQDTVMENRMSVYKEEKVTTTQAASMDDMQIRSGLARNIHAIAVLASQQTPTIQLNELFRYGRMAYTFQLNVTRPDGSKKVSDAWSIPTAVIRSKGEGQIGMRGSGSAANDLVINKVCKVIEDIRTGNRREARKSSLTVEPDKVDTVDASVASTLNTLQLDDNDDDDDIFADVGRDYECTIDNDKNLSDAEDREIAEEMGPELGPQLGPELRPEFGPELGPELGPQPTTSQSVRMRYFDDDDEDDNDLASSAVNTSNATSNLVNSIIEQATQGWTMAKSNNNKDQIHTLKRKLAQKSTKQLGFDVTDRDAIDYDTFGLGAIDNNDDNSIARSRLVAAATAEIRREQKRSTEDPDHTLEVLAGFKVSKSADTIMDDEDEDDYLSLGRVGDAGSELWSTKEQRDTEARDEAQRERERNRRQRLRKSRKFNKDTKEINEIMTAKFGHGLGDDDDEDTSRKKRRKNKTQ